MSLTFGGTSRDSCRFWLSFTGSRSGYRNAGSVVISMVDFNILRALSCASLSLQCILLREAKRERPHTWTSKAGKIMPHNPRTGQVSLSPSIVNFFCTISMYTIGVGEEPT